MIIVPMLKTSSHCCILLGSCHISAFLIETKVQAAAQIVLPTLVLVEVSAGHVTTFCATLR